MTCCQRPRLVAVTGPESGPETLPTTYGTQNYNNAQTNKNKMLTKNEAKNTKILNTRVGWLLQSVTLARVGL